MKNVLKSAASTSIGLLLVRVPIGLTFVTAAVMKFRGGIGDFVSKSLSLAPSFLPTPLAKTYLYLLPFVELIIGVLLLIGGFTRLAALVAALVLVSILIALPGFWNGQSWAPSANAVLLSVALLLFFAGPGKYAIDSLKFGRSSKSKPAE